MKKLFYLIIVAILITSPTHAKKQGKVMKLSQVKKPIQDIKKNGISFGVELNDLSSVINISNMPLYSLVLETFYKETQKVYLGIPTSISEKNMDSSEFFIENDKNREIFNKVSSLGLSFGVQGYSLVTNYFWGCATRLIFLNNKETDSGINGVSFNLGLGYKHKANKKLYIKPILGLQYNYLNGAKLSGSKAPLKNTLSGLGYTIRVHTTYLF